MRKIAQESAQKMCNCRQNEVSTPNLTRSVEKRGA